MKPLLALMCLLFTLLPQVTLADENPCLAALKMFRVGVTEATDEEISKDIETLFSHEWEDFRSESSRRDIDSGLKFISTKFSVDAMFRNYDSKEKYDQARESTLELLRSNEYSRVTRNFTHEFMSKEIQYEDFIKCLAQERTGGRGIHLDKAFETENLAIILVTYVAGQGDPGVTPIDGVIVGGQAFDINFNTLSHLSPRAIQVPLSTNGPMFVQVGSERFGDRVLMVGQRFDPVAKRITELENEVLDLRKNLESRRKLVNVDGTGPFGRGTPYTSTRMRVRVACPPGADYRTGIYSTRFDVYENMTGVDALVENIRHTPEYWEGDVLLVTNGGMPEGWRAQVSVTVVWDELPEQ